MKTYYQISDHDLLHHGVKGQKWGIRRYQNADGSLTDEGYRHWGLKKSYHGLNKEGKKALDVLNATSKFKREAKRKGYTEADTKKFMNEMSKQIGNVGIKSINKAAVSRGNARIMKYMGATAIAGLTISAIATGGLSAAPIAGAVQFTNAAALPAMGGALAAYGKNAIDDHRRNKVYLDLKR